MLRTNCLHVCLHIDWSPYCTFNRLLDTLRSSPKDNKSIALDNEAQADITWINQFLSHYNGVQLIHSAPSIGIPVVLDSCFTGAGGHFGKLAFHTPYPPHIIIIIMFRPLAEGWMQWSSILGGVVPV